MSFRRGAGAVELATLERWYTGNGIVGSPEGTPSEESHPQMNQMDRSDTADVLRIYSSESEGWAILLRHCEKMEKRLHIHNAGKVRYTKGHIPYKLHYFEKYPTRKEAAARERFFKTIDGFVWLRCQGIIE